MRIGDKVITPEWKTGTLIAITSKGYTVKLDDGGIEIFDTVMVLGDK